MKTSAVRLAILAVALLRVALPSLAGEPVGEEKVRAFLAEWKKGEQLYNDYDYETAFNVLTRALAEVDAFPELSRATFRKELIDGYRYLAYSAIALEKYGPAEDAFSRILTLDPGFDPGEVSPKIRAVFDEARKRAPSVARGADTGKAPTARAARIEHDPIRTFHAGEPITVRATIRPQPLSAEVVYRSAKWLPYRRVRMLDVGDGVFVAAIAGSATARAKIVQYYIEVVGEAGAIPVSVGSQEQPWTIDPAPPSENREPDIPEPSAGDAL